MNARKPVTMDSEPQSLEYAERHKRLLEDLSGLDSLAVAFSGGVDSSVLLHAAHAVLGDRAVALVADSASLPRRELRDALSIAEAIGARIEVIRTDEQSDPNYLKNAGDRCYFCKAALFRAMQAYAQEQGYKQLAFGEITDDFLDDRPGARAAREFRVLAPLSTAGFSKEDVRRYARKANLPVADKPASACLASRIPVGTRVTAERLRRIEQSEDALLDLGLKQLRVRDRGERARVEVGAEDLPLARALQMEIKARLARQGFAEFEIAEYHSPTERSLLAD